MNVTIKQCNNVIIMASVIFTFSHFYIFTFSIYGESRKERMADALAHGGDEGRDKLR